MRSVPAKGHSGLMKVTALLLLIAALAHADEKPTVSVPLDDYLALNRRADGKPDAKAAPTPQTIVEAVRLEGSLARGMTITIRGRAIDGLAPIDVFDASTAPLFDCTGDGFLTISGSQTITLTPLKPKFSLRCKTTHPDAAMFKLTVLRVLDITSEVRDGFVELVEDGGLAKRTITISPKSPVVEAPKSSTPAQVLPPTATGRYRLTLLPDDTRFMWHLSAHNPNASKTPFTLSVRAGDVVAQVTAQVPYETTAEGLRFELPSGDQEIFVVGTMKAKDFAAPVESAAQYLLVETHPLLRADVATPAHRISIEQTGITAQYAGAQAFLLTSGQSLGWSTSMLETLVTDTYSVKSVHAQFFVGDDGDAMAQSDVALNNQGASELALPLDAQPVFASNNEVPAVLTHNARGELSLPLSPGVQKLTVQHRQTLNSGWGFATGELHIPAAGGAANEANVEVRMASEWTPLFASFAGKRFVAGPAMTSLMKALFFAIWAAGLLAWVGVTRARRFALATVLGLLPVFTPAALPVLALLAAGSMLWLLSWMKRLPLGSMLPRVSTLGGVTAAVAIGCLVLVGGVTMFGDNIRRLYGMSADALAGEDTVAQGNDAMLNRKSMRNFGSLNSYGAADTSSPAPNIGADPSLYRGLPAQLELPSFGRTVTLSRTLFDAHQPSAMKVLLVSTSWVRGLEALLALGVVLLGFFSRGELRSGLRRRIESLVEGREPVTA